jgi:hypothetical protein
MFHAFRSLNSPQFTSRHIYYVIPVPTQATNVTLHLRKRQRRYMEQNTDQMSLKSKFLIEVHTDISLLKAFIQNKQTPWLLVRERGFYTDGLIFCTRTLRASEYKNTDTLYVCFNLAQYYNQRQIICTLTDQPVH